MLIVNLVDRERAGRRVRWHEALIDEDVHRFGVIDGQQGELIDVGDFPQLFGELHPIAAGDWLQTIARDPEVLPRRLGRTIDGLFAGHDAEGHSERAGPGDVGEEAVGLAIPRIEERAGALEDLLLQHIPVGASRFAAAIVVGLRHAIRPYDAQHVGFQPVAKTEVDDRLIDDPHLVQIFGAQLEP